MTDFSMIEMSATKKAGNASLNRRRVITLSNIGLAISVTILLFVVIAALWPALITGFDPIEPNRTMVHQPPNFTNLFGTDHSGRDVFARVIYGTGPSLLMGVQAVTFAVIVGSLVGMISGLSPRWLDLVLLRITELFMAFPEFLIALVVVAILGKGPAQITIGITVAMVPAYIRMARVLTFQIKHSDYLLQDKVMGVPLFQSVRKQVLPNVLANLTILAIIGFSTAITAGAALSFLGLGLLPPSPEWGVIMNEGRNQLHNAWWVTITAGLVLAATVVSVTTVARFLERTMVAR